MTENENNHITLHFIDGEYIMTPENSELYN